MLTTLREFLTRSDDGQEMMLCECEVENDIRNARTTETTYRSRYFRQAEGGMSAMRAEEIEPGVFKLDDGLIVREVMQD